MLQGQERSNDRSPRRFDRRRDVPPGHLRPMREDGFGYSEARHLLWRAGFGGTPDQIRLLASWGVEKAVDHLVNVDGVEGYPSPAADRFDGGIIVPLTMQQAQQYRRAQQTGDEETLARFRMRRQGQQRADRRQILEMQRWWLERMIETPRPLEEKMTLFWHSHFATSYRAIENSYHMFMQNQLFRRNAVGNFGELLFRIIRDPAMLAYLDNQNSRRGSPNENLARELMELFSLGEGGYSERDIKEGARALTGYGYSGNQFLFRNELHDTGGKSILGKSGPLDGDDFVRAILARTRCSEFIAMKLYEFFVAALPDESGPIRGAMIDAIEDMASTIREHRYDIGPALSRLFRSEHFYHERFRGEQIKSPAELVVGAVRSLRTPVRSLAVLNDAMGLMGQRLFLPPSVAGWPGGRAWVNTSTLFVRQNVLNFLLTGRAPDGFDPLAEIERYDPEPLLDDLRSVDPDAANDPARVAAYLSRFMLGSDGTASTRAAIDGFLERTGNRVTPGVVTGVLVLLSAAPEYQLC